MKVLMEKSLRAQQPTAWSAPPAVNRPEKIGTHIQGKTPSHSNGGGQPPTELLAHLILALSRYLRQLRTEGGRVPAQVEALIAYLTNTSRAVQEVSVLESGHTACHASAMSRRLLITKSEAAEALGVSLRTIERLISAGRLPLVHVEGAARVRLTDLEAYVHGLEANGGP